MYEDEESPSEKVSLESVCTPPKVYPALKAGSKNSKEKFAQRLIAGA